MFFRFSLSVIFATIYGSSLHLFQLVQEMLPKKGWISGTEKSYEWVEQLHGGKINNFPNPIHLTERMAFAISDLLPEIEKKQIESVILFSNDCSFQQIELSSGTVEVLKYKEINRWVSSLAGQVLSNEQISSTYISLKKYCKN